MTGACETPSSGHVKTSTDCNSLSPSTGAQGHQHCSLQLPHSVFRARFAYPPVLQWALVLCPLPLLLDMRSKVGLLGDKATLFAGWFIGVLGLEHMALRMVGMSSIAKSHPSPTPFALFCYLFIYFGTESYYITPTHPESTL